MAEDATTMQTETLDSAIDNSSEVEGQEAENIQTSSTDENEPDGEETPDPEPAGVWKRRRHDGAF